MEQEEFDLRAVSREVLERVRARRIWLGSAAYTVMILLTWGWCYNHPYDVYSRCADPKVGQKYHEWCTSTGPAVHFFGSLIGGALWPVTIASKISLAVTNWP